ncbi:Mobile element protein [Streptococcus thermophilus]|nr:Mobile element protein [Streptococcus thermophilus]
MPTNFISFYFFTIRKKRVDEFFELIQENLNVVNHYFQTVFRTFLRHKQYTSRMH